MKKLKCSSCGAELKIEDNKEYAICEHCKSKYKLNEDLNINIKMDEDLKDVMKQGMENTKKTSKIVSIIAPIIIVGVLISIFAMRSNFNKEPDQGNKQIADKINQSKEEFEKSAFNLKFNSVSGTIFGSSVERVLDDIISSNKTNDRKINLVYNGETTTNEERIIDIKHSLDKWDSYEVSVNYDSDGYVNEIKVEKVA